MKKLFILCAFLVSLGLFANSTQAPVQAQKLSDAELEAVQGGKITAYCVNGTWTYVGDNTWVCDGDAIIVVIN